MKILFLTSRLPFPVIGGDKLRVYNILKELKKLGHEITLISLYDNDEDLEKAKQVSEFYSKLIPIKFNKKLAYISAVKAIFNDLPFTVQYFYNDSMQDAVDKELNGNSYDLAFCHLIRTAPYLKNYKNITKAIDLTDAISYSYKRRLETNRSLFDKFKISIEQKRILAYEIECVKNFNKQFLISEYDKGFLARYANVESVEILQNGVDTDYFYFYQGEFNPNKIAFIGNMTTIANHDAAMYFGKEIFPLVKEKNPNAIFQIIGANPKPELLELARKTEGIDVTGKVDDVREYLKDAALSVCPVRIAAGVQNKILESMSMGVPVITTTIGAEGINAVNGIDLIAKDKKDEIVSSLINLMADINLRKNIAANSRNFILETYYWQSTIKALNNILDMTKDSKYSLIK